MADKGETPERYAVGLTLATTLEELQQHVAQFADLAIDALALVQTLSEADFKEFRRGLKLERTGKFAGPTWASRFVVLCIPQPMMNVTQVAMTYGVPFNVALKRMRDVRPDLLQVQLPEVVNGR